MKLLLLFPPLLFCFPLRPPLVSGREPFFAGAVLFFEGGVFDHAGVHGVLLGAAEEGGSEGAVEGAGCEFWAMLIQLRRRGEMWKRAVRKTWRIVVASGKLRFKERNRSTSYFISAFRPYSLVIYVSHLLFLACGEWEGRLRF
jgi:hypothetical protein